MEQIKELDPTVLVAMIGVLAALVSATVGALVSRWQTSASFKDALERYELERRHLEGAQYLDNARAHTETVYVPLSSTLASLKAAYQKYLFNGRANIDRVAFLEQIDNFVLELQRLERHGATAFLTTELEEKIIAFTTFIRASKTSIEPKVEIIYDYSISLARIDSRSRNNKLGSYGPKKLLARLGSIEFNIPGLHFALRTSDLVQAPVESEEFQARFQRDTHRISVLVKEVTLGGAAKR